MLDRLPIDLFTLKYSHIELALAHKTDFPPNNRNQIYLKNHAIARETLNTQTTGENDNNKTNTNDIK